jgi:hypothetical protein
MNGKLPPLKVEVIVPLFRFEQVGLFGCKLTENTGPGFKCATFTIILSLQPNVRSLT